MVSRTPIVAAGLLATLLAGSTCKVPNEDHCANQDVPGNEFCVELNRATPYCSPCRRAYHGCVDYEPYACEGYYDEVAESEDGGTPESSDGEASGGTTEASTEGPSSGGVLATDGEPSGSG